MDVFVYGTLTERDTAAAVLEQVEYAGPAVIEGLHRVEGTYPTLLPGGTVEGRVLVTEDVAGLDHYEGVDRGLYTRVEIPARDGVALATYVGDPGRLGIDEDWPGTGTFERRVRRYVDDHDVVARRLSESKA